MLMMNFSEPQYRERLAKQDRQREEARQAGWQIIDHHHAPFDCFTVHNPSGGEMIEVASVDYIAETFIEGGGSIEHSRLHIPGIGTLISCRDTIGQLFSYLEEELPAKPEKIML